MSLRAITPGPSRLLPSIKPRSPHLPLMPHKIQKRYLTFPHPDLASANGATNIRIRTTERIPSFLHALQILKHLETKFSTPITTIDLPKDSETLLPGNTMLVTFLRPVQFPQPLVIDIPVPEIGEGSNYLGGPSLEDMDRILLGNGGEVVEGNSEGQTMQVRVEVARSGTVPGQTERRDGRPNRRTEKEVKEDDEILDALEGFGEGNHGGFAALLKKYGRKPKSKGASTSNAGIGAKVGGKDGHKEEVEQAVEEEIPNWSFDITKAQTLSIPVVPPPSSTNISTPTQSFRPSAFKTAPAPPPTEIAIAPPPKVRAPQPTKTPQPKPLSPVEKISQTVKDGVRERARAQAIAAHEAEEERTRSDEENARLREQAESQEAAEAESRRIALAERNRKLRKAKDKSGRPQRVEAEVIGSAEGEAPARQPDSTARRTVLEPIEAEEKKDELKKGLLGRWLGL